MLDSNGVEFKAGVRVWHSDEFDETFGTLIEITESSLTIHWDGDSEASIHSLGFLDFISVALEDL